MNQEQAKYAAWIKELETRRETLERNLRYFDYMVPVTIVLAPFGLFASKWVALGVVAVGIVIAAIGRYLIMMYRWDYKLQIERAHSDAQKLAEYRAAPHKFDLPQDADDEERARYAKHRIPRRAVWR
ncbi:hypothetical protein LVJ94_20565 [Pendulispora rubella]|uniref:Uncharacterized protein n=1 Tax=Pendulispora rubella TaxID=2741070 RepID=A0ABZ2LKE9_9BACT